MAPAWSLASPPNCQVVREGAGIVATVAPPPAPPRSLPPEAAPPAAEPPLALLPLPAPPPAPIEGEPPLPAVTPPRPPKGWPGVEVGPPPQPAAKTQLKVTLTNGPARRTRRFMRAPPFDGRPVRA